MDRTTKDPDISNPGTMGMTMSKVKVYELAKELGMDSMTLLDKLKQLDIDVKSHMSALGSEEVKIVRDQIAKEHALQKRAATHARKTSEPVTQKRVGTTVIRRRAKASDEGQAVEEAMHPTPAPVAHEPSQEPEPQQATVAETQEVVPVAEETATPEATVSTPAQPELISSARKIIITRRAERPAESAPRAEAPARPIATTTTPQRGISIKIPSLLGARNEGISPSRSGSVLNIVKEEPKKPAAPRVVPNVRPVGSPPVSGVPRPPAGIVNIGKEAIDRMVEEEQNFKKKGSAGRGEREREPTDVKVSDYRAKKELVFLPKKKKVPITKEIKHTEITTPAAHKRVIKMENAITMSDLAQRIGAKATDVLKKLIGMGVMANLNHPLDIDTATLIASEYGYEVENIAFKEEELIPRAQDKDEDLKGRPPIVTVMGHVDHGKTSLLDAIRSTNVAGGEAGGITQHIGAYTVDVKNKPVTFIDTPGHEAFTMMRSRGANVTDIVILVVAADDGVMPQTREAVDHARAASVPILVAVNKIDKPGANPDRALKGLSELGLIPEAWGGENIFVNVSALKKTGIEELLENILLQAEVLELKANPDRLAEGVVLEAKLDRSRGAIVTILIKKGTLKVGDSIVAGQFCGRVRALTDDKGKQMQAVGPGYAAEILGLEGVPTAGDAFNAMKTEAEAREVAGHRAEKAQAAAAGKSAKMTLEELFAKVQQGEVKELPIILKTDAFGSSEAIKDSLTKLSTEKVKVKILSSSTGGVSESDVMLASASNAIIVGFNVRPETKARQLAEAEKIDIKLYSIIYELLDDVKKAMGGLLEKKAVEKYLGRAEVRETFTVPKVGVIAGSFVIDGKITRGCNVRLLRDSRVVYTGKLSSLKRFKDDAKEVAQGYECGMGIENYNDLKQGDVIEAFMIEMVAQELDETRKAPEAAKA